MIQKNDFFRGSKQESQKVTPTFFCNIVAFTNFLIGKNKRQMVFFVCSFCSLFFLKREIGKKKDLASGNEIVKIGFWVVKDIWKGPLPLPRFP